MCVGIDESNHGRFPEFYVAAFSEELEFLKRVVNPLIKIRNENDLEGIISEIKFRWIIIPEDFSKFFLNRKDNIRLMAYIEFMRYFNRESKDPVFLIDRKLKEKEENIIRNIVLPYKSKIISETDGDMHYPIIHFADAIANYLYKTHTKGKDNILDKWGKYLITPRPDEYNNLERRAKSKFDRELFRKKGVHWR